MKEAHDDPKRSSELPVYGARAGVAWEMWSGREAWAKSARATFEQLRSTLQPWGPRTYEAAQSEERTFDPSDTIGRMRVITELTMIHERALLQAVDALCENVARVTGHRSFTVKVHGAKYQAAHNGATLSRNGVPLTEALPSLRDKIAVGSEIDELLEAVSQYVEQKCGDLHASTQAVQFIMARPAPAPAHVTQLPIPVKGGMDR